LASVVASRRFVDDCLGFERFLYRLWRWRCHYADQSRNTGRHFDYFDLRHCNREQFTANCKCSADCGVGRAGEAEGMFPDPIGKGVDRKGVHETPIHGNFLKPGAGDGDRTRNQRLGKPLLYH
jgi:hypothetical protein